MYEIFKGFSDIDEVVIPTKKNIREQRYEFVRFLNVNDGSLLSKKSYMFIVGKSLPTYQSSKGVRM